MRLKRFDEELWMIFGEYDTGEVDIADPSADVLTKVPRELAEKIVKAQNASLERCREICQFYCEK